MFELKLNYFTDYKFQDVYSLGTQIVNPSEMECKLKEVKVDDDFFGDINYYYEYKINYNNSDIANFQTDDGVSFKSTTSFNERGVPYIIKIDGKPYAFDFEKTISTEKIAQFLWRSNYKHYTSNFDYFLYKVYDSTTHITDGDGVYKNLKLELTDIFRLYEYNAISGKFDILSTYGYDVNYVSFKVNYYSRGAQTHEDSLFNQIGEESAGGVIWENC